MFRKIIENSPPVMHIFICAFIAFMSLSVLSIGMNELPYDTTWNIVRQLLGTLLMFVLPPLLLLDWRGETMESAWRIIPQWDWKLWLPAVFVLLGLLSLGEWITSYFQGLDNVPEWWETSRQLQESSTDLLESIFSGNATLQILGFVMIVVLAPIGEEFFFRGTIQRLLYPSMRGWLSILLTTALFAFIHFQIDNFAAILILGLALGILYHRTRSLWVTIVAHMVYNGVNFAFEEGWMGWPAGTVWTISSAAIALALLFTARKLPATPVLLEPQTGSLDRNDE